MKDRLAFILYAMSLGSRLPAGPTRILALVATLLSGGAALGEEGRIPIFEPIVITESGKYVVTRSIAAESPVIFVQGVSVLEVDIDLNGYVLSGTNNGTTASTIDASSPRRLVVRNGTVLSERTGISSSNATDSEVIIEDVDARGDQNAINVSGSRKFVVRRCTLTGSTNAGILMNTNSNPFQSGVIEDNVIHPDSGDALLMIGTLSNLAIRRNRIHGPGAITIRFASGFSIVDNNINVEGGVGGISLVDSNNCIVGGNTLAHESGGFHGLRLQNTSDCLIFDNTITGFPSSGIDLSSSSSANRLDRNAVNNNLIGVYFRSTSTQNVLSRTLAIGNTDALCVSAGACLAPGVCDQDGGNFTTGDNFVPGPC